jgi:hypothetical protein
VKSRITLALVFTLVAACSQPSSTTDGAVTGDAAADASGDASSGGTTTCPAVPCASGQVCADGFCVPTPPNMPCGTNPFAMDDMCGMNAVCLPGVTVDGQMVSNRQCYAFPPCPASGMCPVGPFGSVCNDGILTDKARMCLAGLCLTVDNCPANWHCVLRNSAPTYGYCSSGASGSLCKMPSDCQPGLICHMLGTAIGTCM